ncbi:inner membrane transport protein YbaT [bacterium BMS3Abin05]|nr:inner membrane transport protein YbaT [bacterium BMS3Abin05]GBE28030.1 inner membrane transport protein YbaT [bacterium BMS3Bbin03]HDK36127.1 amino acid permease [Bacteroidota bacterium]
MPKQILHEKLDLKELVAMGVGGMVGGGIFSVLGLSVGLAGHAAYFAFAVGGIIALLTGHSYGKLGLAFRSDGGSFTYMEKTVKNENIAAIGGWLLLVGYIGTLALYSYTFGIYGAAMTGSGPQILILQHFLESFILLLFLGINLYGIKAAGHTEVLIVLTKVIILFLFAGIGIYFVKSDHLFPIFNTGGGNMIIGAAVIFVAYEGFELIPNAVHEMKNPGRDLPRSILISIIITIIIYLLVSFVAVGNLSGAMISKYKEYALAAAAKPFLGQAGFVLIGIGALLSTASAINATLFGTARLGMVMAQDKALPKAFSFRERTRDIPWLSLVLITLVTLVFVNVSDLTLISSFASSTFLLIFIFINYSAIKLHKQIGIGRLPPLLGLILSAGCWIILIGYLWQTSTKGLEWIGGFYAFIILAELAFSERRILRKK